MKAKNLTNEQRLKNLIKTNSPLLNALLVERLLLICELTSKEIEELHSNGKSFSVLVSDKEYVQLCKNVNEILFLSIF